MVGEANSRGPTPERTRRRSFLGTSRDSSVKKPFGFAESRHSDYGSASGSRIDRGIMVTSPVAREGKEWFAVRSPPPEEDVASEDSKEVSRPKRKCTNSAMEPPQTANLNATQEAATGLSRPVDQVLSAVTEFLNGVVCLEECTKVLRPFLEKKMIMIRSMLRGDEADIKVVDQLVQKSKTLSPNSEAYALPLITRRNMKDDKLVEIYTFCGHYKVRDSLRSDESVLHSLALALRLVSVVGNVYRHLSVSSSAPTMKVLCTNVVKWSASSPVNMECSLPTFILSITEYLESLARRSLKKIHQHFDEDAQLFTFLSLFALVFHFVEARHKGQSERRHVSTRLASKLNAIRSDSEAKLSFPPRAVSSPLDDLSSSFTKSPPSRAKNTRPESTLEEYSSFSPAGKSSPTMKRRLSLKSASKRLSSLSGSNISSSSSKYKESEKSREGSPVHRSGVSTPSDLSNLTQSPSSHSNSFSTSNSCFPPISLTPLPETNLSDPCQQLNMVGAAGNEDCTVTHQETLAMKVLLSFSSSKSLTSCL